MPNTSQPRSESALLHRIATELSAVPGILAAMDAASDRTALPRRGGSGTPLTLAEGAVAAIWEPILGVSGIFRDDDFFELGGNSLLGVQVLSRAVAQFEADLALDDLLDHPTLAAFAERIGVVRRSAGRPGTPPVHPRARQGETPLSFAQERLWFLDHLEGGNGSVYNMAFAVELSGPLDAPALERALVEIVARHEALRTTFAIRDGKPVQVVSPDPTLRLVVVELGSAPPEAQTDEVRRRSGEAAREPFDLAAGPLIRATLLRLGGGSHVLLLTVHHIVFDGWSMGIFQRELRALYEAFSGGGGAQVPPPALQYADFALWQREWLRGTVLEEQLGYWRRRLEGAPRLLELPGDRPRPAVQSYRGALHRTELGVELTGRLHELGREAGCTLFMTLLAGFSALLGRYTGERDVVVASPIANRNRVELEEIIGFFVNTLVLRMDLEGDPPFGGLLARARETATGAYDHQDLPFERLVEELRPERNLSHNPLAQVSLILQNTPSEHRQLRGIVGRQRELHAGTARFDLTLIVEEGAGGLECAWEYATDLFDGTTVARMAAHFRNLLEGAVAGPERPVWELPVLSAAERRQIVVEWNDTGVAYPPACLHHLFERQVARTPAAVAVVFGDEHLTYGELDARANRLAHHLRRAGVGPEARVAIHVERSLEMVVGVLGVLKAGGAYVPLDPGYPPERLSFMMADSGASVLLTQDRLASGAPTSGACVVRLDADWPRIADGDATAPPCGATPANLAYVIYTSGSSGTPKGVMISHDAVVNFLGAMGRMEWLTDGDSLLAVTTLSFDIAILELFLPLTLGARVVILDREAGADGESVAAALATSGATVMQATPTAWRMLVEAGWRGGTALEILCGGEPLSAQMAATLAEAGSSLWNLYGPTETTVWSALARVDAGEIGASAYCAVGWPIANTGVFVLDRHLQPVPVGVAGEIFIGGAGLARGYGNDPAKTAERFVPHPVSGRPGERLYRTGDIGRFRADGAIEVSGRSDSQIKLRGYRIEPGEVECVLRQHPAVREARVFAVRDESGEDHLAALVIPDGETMPSTRELRHHLAGRLPQFMVPGRLGVVDAFPLTPNFKVDSHLLRQVAPGGAPEPIAQAPRTPTERRLAAIWEEVIGSPPGASDDFFEIGGHSMLGARIISRVRSVFGVDLPLRSIFQTPTVASMARLVDTVLWAAEASHDRGRGDREEGLL